MSVTLIYPFSLCWTILLHISDHLLTFEGTNIMSMWETSSCTHYCTNADWLARAIPNPALFHVTIYISAIHSDGLQGLRGTSESLSYKAEAMRAIMESLKDPQRAVADETIAAILLLTNTSVCTHPDAILSNIMATVNA